MKNFKITMILFLLGIITCLPACVSTAVSGAQAVYDRHGLQTSFNDHYIAMKVDRAIYWNSDRYKHSNISINVFNGIVLLTGQVPTSELHEGLTRLVKSIPEVDKIYNLTIVSEPLSTITSISDAWITAKIKSQLIACVDIDPTQIKVVTENGTVYLMGIVYPDQALGAVEMARTTTGVENVVKIFSYLRISKK